MTVAPGDDERPDAPRVPGDSQPPADRESADRAWRTNPTDDDVDAAFADIVSGMITDSVRRHPSGAVDPSGTIDPFGIGPLDRKPTTGPGVDADPDPAAERARRRELRRLERAAELAAFQAQEEQIKAEREADQEHFTPPDPPPLPRPKVRTVGAVLMIIGGILLLARPGILAVGPEFAMVLAALLIVGGAVLLVTGIWRRRGGGDGWDDGAVV